MTVKFTSMVKGFLKSLLLVVWVWFCLKSVELVYEFQHGISPFELDPLILASIPVIIVWFGIFVFVIFKIIKIEF